MLYFILMQVTICVSGIQTLSRQFKATIGTFAATRYFFFLKKNTMLDQFNFIRPE